MQVSNVVSANVNGKLQLSQPFGKGYVGGSDVAVQIATNPEYVSPPDLNFTVMKLVLLMKLHGCEIDPQCFEKLSSSTQAFPHSESC